MDFFYGCINGLSGGVGMASFFYLGEGRFLEVFAEGIVVVREWNPRARGFRLPLASSWRLPPGIAHRSLPLLSGRSDESPPAGLPAKAAMITRAVVTRQVGDANSRHGHV